MNLLQEQLKGEKNPNIKRVGNYLLGRMKTDKDLENAYEDNCVDIHAIWEGIVGEAKAKAVKGCACLEDQEVYDLAVHFVYDCPLTESECQNLSPRDDMQEEVAEVEEDETVVEAEEAKPKAKPTKAKKKESVCHQFSIEELMSLA